MSGVINTGGSRILGNTQPVVKVPECTKSQNGPGLPQLESPHTPTVPDDLLSSGLSVCFFPKFLWRSTGFQLS